MADEIHKRDQNRITTIAGVADDSSLDIVQLRTDPSTDRLKVNIQALDASVDSITIGGHSTIADNRKTVTAAGTAETLAATSTTCKRIEITALPTNTDIVAVGGSTVDAAEGSERGKILYPGDSITIEINDVQKVYVDSRVNGEGISFMYTN